MTKKNLKTILISNHLLSTISKQKTPIYPGEWELLFLGPAVSTTMYIAPLRLERHNSITENTELYVEAIHMAYVDNIKTFCANKFGIVVEIVDDDIQSFNQLSQIFHIKIVLFSNVDLYGYYGFLYLGPLIEDGAGISSEIIQQEENKLAQLLSSYTRP